MRKRNPAKSKKRVPPTLRRLKLETTTVPNPHYNPAHDGEAWNPPRITAVVNVRESAVATLAARRQLNAAQVEAATRFRQLWETMGGAGAAAFDYTKEFVDGGRAPEAISERQMQAGYELARCRDKLGERGYRLIGRVCGEGHALIELEGHRRGRDTAADNLRAFLDDLSELWGLSGKGKNAVGMRGTMTVDQRPRLTSEPIDNTWAEAENEKRRARSSQTVSEKRDLSKKSFTQR